MTYDLAIIGAGPAGCAAAISAARAGASVLLLERGRFPRHKVCGEFVSAESLALLRDLLGPEHQAPLDCALRIAEARIFADHAVVRAEIAPAAASITRFEMDRALWEACGRTGVDARSDCVVQSVEGNGPFYVKTSDEMYKSRALINAAGRWSFLTSSAARNRASKERWVGLKAHFHEPSPPLSVDLYFFDGGYCGVQPVSASANGSGAVVNACAMVRAEVATELRQVLAIHPALEQRSRGWQQIIEPVSTSPLIFHEPEPLQGRILQVGDAATFVDPFVGDGISLALRSGALAARRLTPFFRRECPLEQATAAYDNEYRHRLAPVFRASSRLRNLLNFPSMVRRPVMSLLQRTPLITRQLVRMTR